jgi:hypothetical protein
MDMLGARRIAAAKLTEFRKLAQGLHPRYLVDDFGTGGPSSPRWASSMTATRRRSR